MQTLHRIIANRHSYSVSRRIKQLLLTSAKLESITHRLLSVSTSKREVVLGIETSCDDTGAAVVDCHGQILGESLHSQTSVSVEFGGVLPPYAKAIHRAHIQNVVTDALNQAGVGVKDLDAVAVTVKPGLALCLEVGLTHAKKLVLEHRVPLIPIHHMEAHALTARMIEKIDFPFLVLLVSGGHCILAVANDIDEFLLLGNSLDGSPGEAFDKVARRMKLKNLSRFYSVELSGGAMIEQLAKDGNIDSFTAPNVVLKGSCNFSFAGIKGRYMQYIEMEEQKQGIVASGVISNVADLCASFQYAILKHLAKPLQKAFLFCEMNQLLPENGKTLVVSGGVASNQFLRQGLQRVCDHYNCRLVCPPPKLCTDNGIMIAWNGMEKLVVGRGVAEDPQSVAFEPRSPLGKDITAEVAKSTIKVPKINLF